ncbi:MAG TPA: hypothetical protein VK168_10085 [Saprospiraceae bacterium]|nr:hypothetical protein [Saprospiraceae bacterium]
MKKYLLLLLIGSLSCAVVYGQNFNYAPNSLNIPAVKKRGDICVGAAWGHALNSADVQLTYTPIKHFLVTANYFGIHKKAVRNQADTGTDYFFGEIAAGVYETHKRGTTSLLAGYGGGRIFSNFELNNSSELNLQRWFIQPGYAYKSEFFQAAVGIRFSRLNYAKGNVSFSIDPVNLGYIQRIEQKNPIFLPELGIQAGIVFKPMYLGLAVSSIFPDTNLWDFARLNAALVLSTTFNTRRKG